MDQQLPNYEIIELVKFRINCRCQKQLPVQVFNSTTKSLNKLLDFYKWLNKYKEIFHDKDDGIHPNKKSISSV